MILRLHSLAHDILSAHRLLRVGDKTDLTFPALSCEPKMTQIREPTYVGDLILYVNLVSLGSVIGDLTRVYVVHLK